MRQREKTALKKILERDFGGEIKINWKKRRAFSIDKHGNKKSVPLVAIIRGDRIR